MCKSEFELSTKVNGMSFKIIFIIQLFWSSVSVICAAIRDVDTGCSSSLFIPDFVSHP